MDTYQILKMISAISLFVVALISAYVGKKSNSPYFVNWVIFSASYSVYEAMLLLEYAYQTVTLYQLVQTTRALTVSILIGSILQQSRILYGKAVIFFEASIVLFMLYIIWIPLTIEETVKTFRDVAVLFFNFIRTDIFGLIFGIMIILSGLFLLPIFINQLQKLRGPYDRFKNIRRLVSTIVTMLLIFALGIIIMLRREMIIHHELNFEYFEAIVSPLIVAYIAINLSLSQSHGIQAVLLVDREGNPIIGYSPQKREKISFEEKIIAASGFLSSLFIFVKNYVASSKDEEFKELKTTSSSLRFYAGEKFFLIVQTYLTSYALDQVSYNVLKQIDFYLKDLKVNEMPDQQQIEDLYSLLDRAFYNMS